MSAVFFFFFYYINKIRIYRMYVANKIWIYRMYIGDCHVILFEQKLMRLFLKSISSSRFLQALKIIRWLSLPYVIVGHKYILISFNKLNVLSDVKLVADITMINLASLYTLQRWFLTSRFFNTSVTVWTDPVSRISLQYSDSVFSCTWHRILFKSLSYNATTSLYLLPKWLPFAALRRRFSNLMYVLKSSWWNQSSIALMIQSKDS